MKLIGTPAIQESLFSSEEAGADYYHIYFIFRFRAVADGKTAEGIQLNDVFAKNAKIINREISV